MMMRDFIQKSKEYGFKGCIYRLKTKFKKNYIKNFKNIKYYFKGKHGLEIGGPSTLFDKTGGILPIYKIMKKLDGVNFSSETVWTNTIETENGFIINNHNVGKMFIADAVNLSVVPNNDYDFILSSNNIEHIANPIKAVEQWISKLKKGGVLVIIAPKKDKNFDHKREIVKYEHLLEDYNKNTDEHDLTHLEEILELHDLVMDPPAGTFEQFKERSLRNFENRCLHHHVFDSSVLKKICGYFGLKIITETEEYSDYLIIAEK